jgi:predicted dehydrogenase
MKKSNVRKSGQVSRPARPTRGGIPRILLIGAGSFGEKHLINLINLEKAGILKLAGVVVATEKTRAMIAEKYTVTVSTTIDPEILKTVDAVDIVTPPETHLEVALACLPYTNVLIEKPLATTVADATRIAAVAKKYKRVLMVGHIFRFNPVVERLEKILEPLQHQHCLITGSFTNPLDNDMGRDIFLELPHLFDIVHALFHRPAGIISTNMRGRTAQVSIRYGTGLHATFNLGWEGDVRTRTINFQFSKKEIRCNLATNIITIHDIKKGTIETIDCNEKAQPLEKELALFAQILRGKKVRAAMYPDSRVGIEIVRVAEKAGQAVTHREIPTSAKSPRAPKKIRIAVIGAGIFGTNCALELSKYGEVTVFEKNDDIMKEASYINQYRHHWGYHYPRSDKTVQDIRKAIRDFEDIYNPSIIREFPTYYAIAKSGSKTTHQEYIDFCSRHELPFTIEYPDAEYLNRDRISLSLKTFEPIYDYHKLKKQVRSALTKNKHITIRFGTRVIDGHIEEDGMKSLSIENPKGKKTLEQFDYVINTTYAQYNKFSHWFKFPIKPVRIDLVETLIVKLPLPKISLAIMDGPFTNLVPTNTDNLFTLVHIKESMLERYVPDNGLPRKGKRMITRIKETLEKSIEWLPILKKAEVVDVRYIHRAVNAHREHDDARPSDMTYHGFGCWSILGGKIVNSVSTAKEIGEEIKKHIR